MTLSSANLLLEDGASESTVFVANVAHYFIIGTALFSIFWGVVNAILVRGVNMNDSSPIAKALKEAGIEAKDEENAAIKEGEVDPSSPASILNQMNFIGTKITEGAISFLTQEYLYLAIFSLVFGIILGVTVDW